MGAEAKRRLGALAGCLLAALAVSGLKGCLERHENDTQPARSACTSCHGSAARDGDDLDKAAPPADLTGRTSESSRGVGAHQYHLTASETHGKVACESCHVVPDEVSSPGHADSAWPAEVVFGSLASQDGHSPAYVAEQATCTDTYCHRSAAPHWTDPRSSAEACGSCHGLPPVPPHPQQDQCSKCHGGVIDASRTFIAPELHVNGSVDLGALTCHTCHGSPQSNAPPPDLSGNTSRAEVGVGAHQVHLSGGQVSRAVECGECHEVPSDVNDPGHLDTTEHAELIFSGVAITNGTSPTWDRQTVTCSATWCHGPEAPTSSKSPQWTQTSGPLGCTDCHGKPPAAPHPQVERCSFCHSTVVGSDDTTIENRQLHVNGVVDLAIPATCDGCHGSPASPAPPKDIAGNTDTSAPGVGAHQTHVLGTGLARPVPCDECHVVPTSVLDPGHTDSFLPAELTFSGVALSFSAQPSFDGVRCNTTYCHGASFVNGNASGGANTAPEWTAKNQVYCGSCHSLPPPAPHPSTTGMVCSDCHSNLNGFSIIDPKLHVNGTVDF